MKYRDIVLLDRFDPSVDLRESIYTYAQREERAEMEAKRAGQTDPVPKKDPETDPMASRSLKYLLFIIGGIAVCLILFYIVTRIRKKKYTHTLEK